ncbi:hypothetical protein ACA910_013323 [Epithemia clementina (nom. ined.)]
MSLVGSELNLVLNFDGLGQPESFQNPGISTEDGTAERRLEVTNENIHDDNDDDDDAHPAPTPQSGMESFFLGGLPTQNISAAALAEEINYRHKPMIELPSSADYRTALSNMSDPPPHLSGSSSQIFSRDIPTAPSSPSKEANSNNKNSYNMSYKAAVLSNTTPAATTTTTATRPAALSSTAAADNDERLYFDPAEKIYDTAKGVWGWGKGIFLFSPFLGMAESIAGKMVETAGSSLEGVDHGVTGKLHELDERVLNPALNMIVHIVKGAANQTGGFVKPIILTILKPLDFMIKNRSEHSDEPAPDAVPNH